VEVSAFLRCVECCAAAHEHAMCIAMQPPILLTY